MNANLQCLMESRKEALACLKTALANVNRILQVISSLDNQVVEYSIRKSVEQQNNASPSCVSLTGTTNSANVSPPSGGSYPHRVQLLETNVSLESEGQPSTSTPVAEKASCDNQTRGECDTSSSFVAQDVKFEPVEFSDIQCAELLNSPPNDAQDVEMPEQDPLSPEERVLLHMGNKKPESDSCAISNRSAAVFQPTVRLEVLKNPSSSVGQAKNSLKPASYLEEQRNLRSSKRHKAYTKNYRDKMWKSLAVLRRSEISRPTRVQPKRNSSSSKSGKKLSIDIKLEDESDNAVV